jgi:hypothetical protein
LETFPARDLVSAQARATLAELKSNTNDSKKAAVSVAENATAFADLIERGYSTLPNATKIDCRVGCSYCCHLRVLVTIPEAISIADACRDTMSPEDLAALRARVDIHQEELRGRKGADWNNARPPCPLLKGGCCTVYAHRPLACRGWNSTDVAACETEFREPTGRSGVKCDLNRLAPPQSIALGVGVGLKDAGLQYAPVELIAGLKVALEVPNCAERWLAGEHVFQTAEIVNFDPSAE